MNILIPDSWLREFLDTDAKPRDIQKCLSLCGPSVERLNQVSDDWIYDIEVTTNRVDCMSVIGIAREAAAILPQFGFKAALKSPSPEIRRGIKGEVNKISGLEIVNDPQLCHRVMALLVKNVKTSPSPKNVSSRLEMVGQRSLNNLVDITNYVMWVTGHPVHVFDLDRISTSKMIIRLAKRGEEITTLDEKTHILFGGEVIIDNGLGEIIDLPSIMGTANSIVTENTKNALFFTDDIVASKVRFASMSHAIRTQAATLMEKGVDPGLAALAMSQVELLVKNMLPQAVIGPLLDIYPKKSESKSINIKYDRINTLIGIKVDPAEIKNILISLGFLVNSTADSLSVTPPGWRSGDVQIAEDLIEEVARIYGYYSLPSELMVGKIPEKRGPDKTFYWESRIKYLLKHLGFTETYTYSLVDKDSGIKLKNPLSSEWVYLRTSLIPSHKNIIRENMGKAGELNFFEIANVYLPRKNDLPEEQSHLILSTTGSDFSRFKGIIETIFNDLGLKIPAINIQNDSGCLLWEAPLLPLIENATTTRTYIPISKFTPVIEDVNILLDKPYAHIEKEIKKISPLIKQIDLIDKFGDKLTLRLIFHSDTKQLSSEDVAPIRKKLFRLITY